MPHYGMPQKGEKTKALDLMIAIGTGPKKNDMKDMEEGYSEKSAAEEVLKMHPLADMSMDDLKELSDALESELSSREGEEEESDD
jgi:hypothetical protein